MLEAVAHYRLRCNKCDTCYFDEIGTSAFFRYNVLLFAKQDGWYVLASGYAECPECQEKEPIPDAYSRIQAKKREWESESERS